MDINISVENNKDCKPSDIILGYVGEKNIDRIILNIGKGIPRMNWYLYFDGNVYPFSSNTIMIDERLTNKEGSYIAYILGSDAKPGENINGGKLFFNSNKIIMRVRGR